MLSSFPEKYAACHEKLRVLHSMTLENFTEIHIPGVCVFSKDKMDSTGQIYPVIKAE